MYPPGWDDCVQGLVVVAKNAYEALKIKPRIEDYQDVEKNYVLHAVRVPTGVTDETTIFSEIVLVGTDVLDQEKFDWIAGEIVRRTFFKYHADAELLFSRSVYVLAKQYKGFVRARRFRNQVFVPVLGSIKECLMFIYFADFMKNRIDAMMHTIQHGWKKNKKDHVVYRVFDSLINLRIRNPLQGLSQARVILYYINVIEHKIGEFEDKVGNGIIMTIRCLLNIFKATVRYLDQLLRPVLRRRLGQALYSLLKRFGKINEVMGILNEYIKEINKTIAKREAESYLDLLSKATPIKS